MNKNEVLDKVYEMLQKTSSMLLNAWADKIVFSWRWWLQVALAVLPWILWIKLRDKKRSGRLLFIGMFMALLTNFLD